LDFITYNFISRRKSIKFLLNGYHFNSILDLGCGTGEYFTILSKFTDNYLGVDYSESMISKAISKYKAENINPKFITAPGEELPIDSRSIDMVCAIGYIQYFENPNKAIEEIIRVLKPGGCLIIQTFQHDIYQKLFNLLFFDRIRELLRYFYCKIKRKKYYNYSNKPYSKRALDKILSNYGFSPIDYRYSNFNVFPYLIRKYFPNIYIKLSEYISENNSDSLRAFAVNYNALYKLK
jgi:ubiquinone/menaquinone biosynthesis C-methylase UbiE